MNSNNINSDINELTVLLKSLDSSQITTIQNNITNTNFIGIPSDILSLLQSDLVKNLSSIKSVTTELIYSTLANIISLVQINTISISSLNRFTSSISNTFTNSISDEQIKNINDRKLANIIENSTNDNIINLCTKLSNSTISQKSIKNILRNIS